jgi:hypothetical protein
MGRPRKFLDPFTTSVRMERKVRQIAEALGIELGDALWAGIQVMAQVRMEDKDPRVTAQVLEDLVALRNQDTRRIETYIRIEQGIQSTLQRMQETADEARKPKELVRVWDRAREAYIQIPVDEVNPEWHIPSPKVEASGGLGE